jgi:hypothetical protein
MKITVIEIVELGSKGMCGVYDYGRRGPYGTLLVFKGSEDECVAFVIGDREVAGEIETEGAER